MKINKRKVLGIVILAIVFVCVLSAITASSIIEYSLSIPTAIMGSLCSVFVAVVIMLTINFAMNLILNNDK